ncbi:MAG: hypothetical protein JO306_00990 [Gemmatimonadetes bacterium]|nr:hypothetical protein [Gemmatimonadota bacterium]
MDSPHRPLKTFPAEAADAPPPERSSAQAVVFADPELSAAEMPEWWRTDEAPPAPAARFQVEQSAAGRDSLRIEWDGRADPGPAPADAEDLDAADDYARRVAHARFARRVLERDPHAWVEVLVSYRDRIRLPVDVPFRVSVEPDLSIRLALELPAPPAVPPLPRGTVEEQRTRYAELCCWIALTFAADVFRLLPLTADSVYVTAYRRETNPATGDPRCGILLRLATDRQSVEDADLAHASATAAFADLGGALQLQRGELVPLAFEDDAERIG